MKVHIMKVELTQFPLFEIMIWNIDDHRNKKLEDHITLKIASDSLAPTVQSNITKFISLFHATLSGLHLSYISAANSN